MSTRERIIEIIRSGLYKNYSEIVSKEVLSIGPEALEELYLLATDNKLMLPKSKKDFIVFRSAYVLEYIYFNSPQYFEPFIPRLIIDYCSCENASVQRIFSKMLAHIIKSTQLTDIEADRIAQASVEWISKQETKVAVKVWVMSILVQIKSQVDWLEEIWEDLEDMLKSTASAGLLVRIKRKWK